MTQRSLLASLVNQFATHPENVAVEALGHILRGSSLARKSFSALLGSAGLHVPDGLIVRTQESGRDGARPDLVGVDADDNQVLIIEAKFWAGLTDNQPVTYIRRLPSDRPGVLCFLVPTQRVRPIWYELLDRMKEAGLKWSNASSDGSIPNAVLDAERRICVVSWDRVLEGVVNTALSAGENATANDAEQLLGLCHQVEAEGFIPLSSEELGPEVPILIARLANIIDGTVDSAVAQGVADTAGMRASAAADRYTRYLKWNGMNIILSIHYRFWRAYGRTPVWLEFQDMSMPLFRQHIADFREWESRTPPRVLYERTGAPMFPLSIPLGQDLDGVVGSVIAQIDEIVSKASRPSE